MITHLMVPGLSRRHLDAAWLGNSVGDPAVTADLVCTFPATVATVEATLLTGVEPTLHRRWRDVAPIGTPLHGENFAHLRDDTLAEVLRSGSPGARSERAAVEAVGARIQALLESGGDLVVSGGPAFAPTPRRIDSPIELEGLGSLAIAARDLDASERSKILSTAGVARILDGDGLRSWRGLPVAHAVVAEPGWSFTADARACGRRDLDGTDDGAVVLAWGCASDSWPRGVHDLRIAPTLAARAGIDLPAATDSPLRWT